MVIRMSQNTQVAQGSLATVGLENSAFSASSQIQVTHSSEQRPVDHRETNELRARRAGVAVVSCLAALLASCNVYDSSLLDPEALATGGVAGGDIVVGGSGATHAGSGGGSSAGSDGGSGSIGDAGSPNASNGGADNGGASSVAGAPTTSGGASMVGAGTGGSVEVGGGSTAGAANPTLSMIDG